MGKKAIFGMVLILAALLVISYANNGISKGGSMTPSNHGKVIADPLSAQDNPVSITVLKTIRVVGYVVGITGLMMMLRAIITPHHKRRGAIYVD